MGISGDTKIRVKVARLRPEAQDLPLPAYATDGSAGMDLRACLPADEPVRVLDAGARSAVPTGIAIALPKGTEAQVRPRSGLALRSGITCLNSPGTIDSDYRGEIGVILQNHGDEAFEIRHGDRIAQLVVAPVLRAEWESVDSLTETVRGSGGFGSTGSA